jgi:hypothetical protein
MYLRRPLLSPPSTPDDATGGSRDPASRARNRHVSVFADPCLLSKNPSDLQRAIPFDNWTPDLHPLLDRSQAQAVRSRRGCLNPISAGSPHTTCPDPLSQGTSIRWGPPASGQTGSPNPPGRRSDDPHSSGCREPPVARLPRACPADYNIPDRFRLTVNAGRGDRREQRSGVQCQMRASLAGPAALPDHQVDRSAVNSQHSREMPVTTLDSGSSPESTGCPPSSEQAGPASTCPDPPGGEPRFVPRGADRR